MVNTFEDVTKIDNLVHTTKKSDKKVVVLISTLIPFSIIFSFSLFYIFFRYYTSIVPLNNEIEKENLNMLAEQKEIRNLDVVPPNNKVEKENLNMPVAQEKKEIKVSTDLYLKLIRTTRDQMMYLFSIDRIFYEIREKKVQSDVKQYIDINDISKDIVINLESKSMRYNTKCYAIKTFSERLSTCYEKYDQIYKKNNTPKNYATIRNMCLLQMIIIVLRDFEYYSEDIINSLIDLMLITAYSSNIKQIIEITIGQYPFVPWINRHVVFKNNKNQLKNTMRKKVTFFIKKMKEEKYSTEEIMEELEDFNKRIEILSTKIKNINKKNLEDFLTSLESTEEPEEPEDIKGIVYNKKEKFDGDRFDYKTDTKFRKINLFNESEDRKIEIEIDKIAAIRHINIGFERFSSNHVLACSLTSVFTYPNRIYGCNIPINFKDAPLIKGLFQCEKDIKEKIEKVVKFFLKQDYEEGICRAENICNLNSTLLIKRKIVEKL